ncbi:MarR family winged helix-turn-helix transcriptional regulator [Cellulomonas iranensis]|uniref:MarR family winged helix-turn-helix transcriptional regulator n=1 Tax=Cellulomonas iranensis TaxID=76862 RepID=UPI00385153C9
MSIEPEPLAETLARVSFAVIGQLSRVSAEEDMSLTQLRMLAILRDRHLRMAQLADALGTDRSSTSGLINRAEQRGLVVRQPAADDKRGFTVSLSSEGHAFAARVQTRTRDALEPLLQHLQPSDRDVLAALLTRCIET